MNHDHGTDRVRELERMNAPTRDRYAVFLGEFPRNRYFYCPDCSGPGLTLGAILFKILKVSKNSVLARQEMFRESYWLLDIFGSEVGEEVDDIDYERVWTQVAGLRNLMLEAKEGDLPEVIIPAMSRAPSKMELGRDDAKTFGAKVFRAVDSFPDLRRRFVRFLHSPWGGNYQPNRRYAREVRDCLTAHGFIER